MQEQNQPAWASVFYDFVMHEFVTHLAAYLKTSKRHFTLVNRTNFYLEPFENEFPKLFILKRLVYVHK